MLSIFQVKCRGDELDVTICLVQEVCQTQEYASVICYGFLLTTGQSYTLGYYKLFSTGSLPDTRVCFCDLLWLPLDNRSVLYTRLLQVV